MPFVIILIKLETETDATNRSKKSHFAPIVIGIYTGLKKNQGQWDQELYIASLIEKQVFYLMLKKINGSSFP